MLEKINKDSNLKEPFGNYPIYLILSTWIITWTEPEFTKNYSLPLQIKSFGPQKFQIFVYFSEIALLARFAITF